MDANWAVRLKTFVERNAPSRKPQFWENLSLALRRRVEFELARRVSPGWVDRTHDVALSMVGFDDDGPPLRMLVVPREVMNKALFLYGTVEISETRLVQALLQPGMTFIDVGANIGYYSLIAAKLVGAMGAVHCFEPNSDIRNTLETHVLLNGFENVTISGEALTDVTGTVRFYKSIVSENNGISSIMPGSGLGEAESVPAVTLDDLAARLGRRIDLVKIDVEGAESQVFTGGRSLLSRPDAPALIFESFDVAPMRTFLSGYGYAVRHLHYTLRGGLELRDPDVPFDNIFAAYEPPNYFAAKDTGLFDAVVARANQRRSPSLKRLVGRL
jgi:FkbM family methyltransferase